MTNNNEQSLELAEGIVDNNTNGTPTKCSTNLNHNNESGSRGSLANGEEETCNQDEVKTNVKCNYATQVAYGQFRPDKYFYPQTLNSNIHPIVKSFFEMDLNHIASRYIQLNPFVDIVKLKECLSYKPKYFKWSG